MNRIIDLERERPISLHEAAEYFPDTSAGQKPSHCTIYRWATNGIRGVRLATVRLGRKRLTSESAIQRFLDELAAQDEPAAV